MMRLHWTAGGRAHYRRGAALEATGDYEAAAAYFDALKLDEKNSGLKKALPGTASPADAGRRRRRATKVRVTR